MWLISIFDPWPTVFLQLHCVLVEVQGGGKCVPFSALPFYKGFQQTAFGLLKDLSASLITDQRYVSLFRNLLTMESTLFIFPWCCLWQLTSTSEFSPAGVKMSQQHLMVFMFIYNCAFLFLGLVFLGGIRNQSNSHWWALILSCKSHSELEEFSYTVIVMSVIIAW